MAGGHAPAHAGHGHGHGEAVENPVYGLLAEFTDPDDLIEAAGKVRAEGYRHFDCYSPFPIHGLAEAMHFEDPRVPWFAFFGGITGAILGFGLQYFIAVVDYPMNVGGKPLLSWVQFFPVTFECTVLCTGLATFISQWALNGLPRLHHPIFNGKNFARASQDRFFLCIESKDSKFELEKTEAFLADLGAANVSEVERD
jgi:hypothetical protein